MASDRNEILLHLTDEERREIERYVEIFVKQCFKEHWQVNNWTGIHDSWDNFPSIRSINDHEYAKGVRGIEPKFFAIVCHILAIKHFEGSPLIKSTKY